MHSHTRTFNPFLSLASVNVEAQIASYWMCNADRRTKKTIQHNQLAMAVKLHSNRYADAEPLGKACRQPGKGMFTLAVNRLTSDHRQQWYATSADLSHCIFSRFSLTVSTRAARKTRPMSAYLPAAVVLFYRNIRSAPHAGNVVK